MEGCSIFLGRGGWQTGYPRCKHVCMLKSLDLDRLDNPIRLAIIASRALCREQENGMAERTDIFKVKLSLSYM